MNSRVLVVPHLTVKDSYFSFYGADSENIRQILYGRIVDNGIYSIHL